jgi:hypothetical protein
MALWLGRRAARVETTSVYRPSWRAIAVALLFDAALVAGLGRLFGVW